MRWVSLCLGVLAAAVGWHPAALHADTAPANERITLHVNTVTGEMYFTGVAGSNMSFYQINSASSSLDDATWNSFQDQSILNPEGTIQVSLPGQIIDWMEMGNDNSVLQDMACANMMPSMNGLPVVFDTSTRSYSIGEAFRPAGQEDLSFSYNVDLNYDPSYDGVVVYESGVPEPASLAMMGASVLAILVCRRRRLQGT